MDDVRQFFGQVWETPEGWKSHCPKCGDTEKKFAWNTQKNVGCCFHNSCAWFYQNGGVTLRRITSFFSNTGFEHVIPKVVEMSEEADVTLPKEFKLIKDLKEDIRDSLYAYLNHRQIARRIVDKAKIGYCETGKYWGYMIFPVFDEVGEVVYWQGRRFKNREPKFWNPKSSKKSELVYCVSVGTAPRCIVIVESVINALTIENMEISKVAVMAILGKSLSETQMDYILSHERYTKEIIIALDGDARRDTVGIAERLQHTKCIIKMANVPDGEDINSLGREKAWDIIRSAEVYNQRKRTEFIVREV
jgi:hypothetical protein